ncbi:hypothetical protein BDV27DRAFT_167004 [Aspergillus caelatus]|uniref:Uncharacterized protein n=1 Tax=Aspergillus caelatus TaxID=61420 RepID=A0A5N6ZUR2_9EURO|nr:uncharacterized protein BDV27DRAFT_167004 [Aspergillus caelatus]KAE8361307.1 hypothetical protein BDV27DRAFT_167004 [Aspergillus caelatus]
MANTLEEYVRLETLWDKAIQSPADISLEEKHQMLEWPPLAVMQANSQKYLGQSVEDLFRKAVTDPHSLTCPECLLIKDDFNILDLMDQTKYERNRWQWMLGRPDLQAKREEEKRRHGRPRHLPQEWIQNVIDQGEDKSWGYVWYHRKGQKGWEEFQHQFRDILTTQMFAVVGWDEIEDSKVAEFVEFEAGDSEERELAFLREDFRNRRSRDGLWPGILSNVFFPVADEARVSYSQWRQHSFAWAIDPDWSRSVADEDGYDGRLKISATQIYFRFYDLCRQRN